MCAIAGILYFDSSSDRVNREELLRLRDRMTARGPDGCGEWYSPDRKLGFAHRRLSIIDLSDAGAQPMLGFGRSGFSPQPSVLPSAVISFNGEIYNFRELRSTLESRGYLFRSQSDTEVLLHMYAEYGESMCEHLRGMYAFAIWNTEKRELFLARDPFGIKPLYYYRDAQRFCFASQLKALLTLNHVDRTSDPAGHVGFFLWGHVPDPYTLYKEVRALPAGHTMTVSSDGAARLKEFCNISNVLSEADQDPLELPGSELHAFLHEHLLDSVKHHLIADVPTGVFLSAGLDSTTLAALASETAVPLRTVTLGFDEFRGTPSDETQLSEATAKQVGATHKTIWVGRNDFKKTFKRLMHAMDRPTTDGVNTFFISEAAVEAGLKVALSGLGGDELFGSYPSFREIPKAVAALRKISIVTGSSPLARGFRLVSAPVCKRLTSPKYAGLLEYGGTYGGAYLLRRGMFMPWELPGLVGADVARAGWEELQPITTLERQVGSISNPHLRVASLEMQNYMRNQLLRDTDWASMEFSLEIRTPLVDLPLTRAIAPLFAGKTRITKRDMARAPKNAPSAHLLNRSKTGFVVPVRDWLLASDTDASRDRGLRGWARYVYRSFTENAR
jgi:asparagine synthase (glutamine-hydrolysing)